MAGYPMPYPSRRRHPARTPPFMPSATPMPEDQAIPNIPVPQSGGGGFWQNLLNNPALATYAAGAAQRLLAPQGFGQSTTGHIVGGLLGGMNDVAAQRMLQAQMQAAGRAENREERKVKVTETAEERQQREQRSVANKREMDLGYEGERVGIARQEAKTKETEAQNRAQDREARLQQAEKAHALAEKRVEIEAKRASVAQQALNETSRRNANADDVARLRVKATNANTAAMLARLQFDQAKEERAAIQADNMIAFRRKQLAYQQAAREMQAEAQMIPTGNAADNAARVEAMYKRAQESVKRIEADLAKNGMADPVEYTESAPVQPAQQLPTGTPAPSGVTPSAPVAGGTIRVKIKATGQTGTIDPKEFDPKTMEKI